MLLGNFRVHVILSVRFSMVMAGRRGHVLIAQFNLSIRDARLEGQQRAAANTRPGRGRARGGANRRGVGRRGRRGHDEQGAH